MSSPVLSVLGNCALGGLALASLFGTWSQQKIFSEEPILGLDASAGKTNAVTSWTHTLFETDACDVYNKVQFFSEAPPPGAVLPYPGIVGSQHHRDGPMDTDAPPLDCTHFYSVLEFLTLGGMGVEQKSFAIVSAAFAVIATILAIINTYSCANALLQSAFGDAGIPIKNAVSWGWLFNLFGAISWIISWATYTHFAGLMEGQIELYEESIDDVNHHATSNTYGYGFALAVIMSGLTIIVGVINLLVARASVNATGSGTVSGNWFAFSTVLAIVTACVAIGGMVSPWFILENWTDRANALGTGEGSPNADSSRQTIGLYYSEDCSWEHFATLKPDGDDGYFEWTAFEVDCVERIATSADYSFSQGNAKYENEDVAFQNLFAVMGAFQAGATVFAWASVFIQLAVIMRIKAGDAAAVTCNGWFSSQTAFWFSLINVILSCITWPIAAYVGWTLVGPYTEDPNTIDFHWQFSSGFVLAVLGGISAFFSTLSAYWSLTTVGAAPESSTATASFVHAFFTGAPAAAALPKPVLVSKPRAGTAAIATLRSSLISVANAGTAFAALFGVWAVSITEWSVIDSADPEATIQQASASYSLNRFVECSTAGYFFENLEHSGDIDYYYLNCNEFTFQDYYWNLDAFNGTFQYRLEAATLAFTIISTFVAFVAAYLAILAALGKPSATAHYANVVTAIIGLITWPIAYAAYIKSLAIDYDRGVLADETVNAPVDGFATANGLKQETTVTYGPAFAQAILSQCLCFVWLVDYFVWTKAEEAGVDAEEKAAESPA